MAFVQGAGRGTSPSTGTPRFERREDISKELAEIRRRRAARSGITPSRNKVTEVPGPTTPTTDEGDAILREQNRLARAAQEREIASSIAELDALINRLRLEETSGLSDLDAQVGLVGIESGEAADEGRRQTKINRAITQRGLAGRGLALSGIRSGAEGRISADLERMLGRITAERGRREDALRRAMEELKTRTRSEQEAARAKRDALAGG